MSRASPARVAAARAMVAVEAGAHLDEALEGVAPEGGVDRDLAWFLAFGAVRHRGIVDASLRPHLSRTLGSLDAEVRAVLRVGAFESLYARTKPHAVVHQGVEVARALKLGRASGLVNAVLRKVKMPTQMGVAEGLSHPAWLVDRWTRRYGEEAVAEWCAANNEPPPLFVVALDPSDPRPPIAGAVPAELDGKALPGVWRLDRVGAPIPSLPGFPEGRWWVQDAAAVSMADLVPANAGDEVLDACAAPGGKSLRLASRGARVTATDRDPLRLDRMRHAVDRVGLDITMKVHDWEAASLEQAFDAVLVDAPCTALGTVRRHPEIRWRRQPRDVTAVTEIQRRLLDRAAAAVRPGGTLVYSVCSPEPEEGSLVVSDFLAEHRAFEQEVERLTAPPESGEDAHYGVRLRRTQ